MIIIFILIAKGWIVTELGPPGIYWHWLITYTNNNILTEGSKSEFKANYVHSVSTQSINKSGQIYLTR